MALIQNMTHNNMINNFLSSVTGNTNKAYILLCRNKDESREDDTDFTGSDSGLDGLAATLNGAVDTMASSSKNALAFTGMRDIQNALGAASGDFMPVQVQYNPSSVRFTGTQGMVRRCGVGGQDQFAQMDVPVETVMQVELDFDDTNIKDAFMFENLNIMTAGGALQSLEQIGAAIKDGGYSVQDISEVFVGAMVRPSTRWVAFVWNKMIFWGELNNVNVRYTMFNPVGNPIRSKVTLRIRQDRAAGATSYQTEETWQKAFKKMFRTKYKTNGMNVNNKLSNLIQY